MCKRAFLSITLECGLFFQSEKPNAIIPGHACSMLKPVCVVVILVTNYRNGSLTVNIKELKH